VFELCVCVLRFIHWGKGLCKTPFLSLPLFFLVLFIFLITFGYGILVSSSINNFFLFLSTSYGLYLISIRYKIVNFNQLTFYSN
jgi:hypothetical protein